MRRAKRVAWKPALWEVEYRSVLLWVEEVYASGRTWEWKAGTWDVSGRSRSKTKLEAQRAAVRYVDKALALAKGDLKKARLA